MGRPAVLTEAPSESGYVRNVVPLSLVTLPFLTDVPNLVYGSNILCSVPRFFALVLVWLREPVPVEVFGGSDEDEMPDSAVVSAGTH